MGGQLSDEETLEERLAKLEVGFAELKVHVVTQGRLVWAIAGVFIISVAVALVTR